MKKIIFDDPYLKKNIVNNDNLYNFNNHISYLYNIYHNIDFSYNNMIHQEIKKKYSSYKSQDKKKNRFDELQYITYNELIEKLYKSQLKCYYCQKSMILMYKNKNEKSQWSLERFDNNLGHYKTNTCICCLKCNLQRRNDNHEYFKLSKQINIIKK